MSFDFLKKFITTPSAKVDTFQNSFYPLSADEIIKAEHKLGCCFPSQLKTFYKELGYGFLIAPENPPEGYDFCGVNRIIDPLSLADIVLNGPDSEQIMPATYELLEPGDLPFFEIGESSSFLLMKLNSDNPNAVWRYNIKIEDSFEKFIWRLYYESPWFYDDIIEAHYKK